MNGGDAGAPEAPQTLVVAGHRIMLRHPERLYFPHDKITKREVVEHYARVGAAMTRHTRGRGLVLKRFPEGIAAEGFVQRRLDRHAPDWIGRAELPAGEGTLTYATGDDPATFAWLAGIGTIEFHAMLSRTDRAELPDQIIFDLDPPEDYTDEVRLTALALKAICHDLGLASFVKSTGSRGYHVVLPIAREFDFDATRAFAKALAARLVAQQPDRLTLEFRKARRQGRILVDIWRNGRGQTAVAPFSLRARPGAPVAVPLDWSDLAGPEAHPRATGLVEFAADPDRWTNKWPRRLGPACRIGAAWAALRE